MLRKSQDGVSLQTEAGVVSKEMITALQKKANICGVKVLTYELADLQYAPEIAQGNHKLFASVTIVEVHHFNINDNILQKCFICFNETFAIVEVHLFNH